MRIGADDGPVMVLLKDTGHACGLCGEVKLLRNRYLSYGFRDHDDGQLVYFHVACAMEAHYSGDDNVVVQASSTSTTIGEVSDRRLATLQNAPVPVRRTGRFRRFCKVAFLVARVSYSVATLDPVGLVTAVGRLGQS